MRQKGEYESRDHGKQGRGGEGRGGKSGWMAGSAPARKL